MYSKEFKKIYHPRLGRYVYEHRGNGLIVDNLFKPLGRKAKEIGKKVLQPFLKAKAKERLSKAGEKLGQRAIQKVTVKLNEMTSERAGDLIRKRLDGISNGSRQGRKANVKGRRQKAQDVNTMIDNLIAMS